MGLILEPATPLKDIKGLDDAPMIELALDEYSQLLSFADCFPHALIVRPIISALYL
jgi:hypothetical protein